MVSRPGGAVVIVKGRVQGITGGVAPHPQPEGLLRDASVLEAEGDVGEVAWSGHVVRHVPSGLTAGTERQQLPLRGCASRFEGTARPRHAGGAREGAVCGDAAHGGAPRAAYSWTI